MSAENKELNAENINFFAACRENTGRALCDSGDHYGRQYDKPAIDENSPIIKCWEAGSPATINTAVYLNDRFKIDRELQKACEDFGEEETDLSWFELGEKFMESKGYRQLQRENVYNTENNFDQVFIFEVWCHEDKPTYNDIYANDAVVTVFYMHCGCDVRGGYGRPLFTRSRGDYSIPVELFAGYYITDGFDADGEELIPEVYAELGDQWDIGYSSYPYGQLERDVEEFLEESRTNDTVCARLKTGELVTIQAYVSEVN